MEINGEAGRSRTEGYFVAKTRAVEKRRGHFTGQRVCKSAVFMRWGCVGKVGGQGVSEGVLYPLFNSRLSCLN